MPFSVVPAGQLDTGSGAPLGFGFRAVPREMLFGVGERGVLEGCEALVDVAAEPGDAVVGEKEEMLVEKTRKEGCVGRRADALRRQERQIMVVILNVVVLCGIEARNFWGCSTGAENNFCAVNIRMRLAERKKKKRQ
jgi:hypothetical protein